MKLDKYFTSLVEHILIGWVGGDEIARATAYLYGTESFWDTEEWSGWVFKRLCSLSACDGNVNWDTLVGWMLTGLAETSQMFEDRQSLLAQSNRDEEEMDERDRVWAKVVGKFCVAVVEDKEVQSINCLDEHNWFEWSDQHSKAHSVVERIMEEQLTTALGRWYREADHQSKDDYITKIEIMVWLGTGLEKVTAVFLIYHTIPNTRPDLRLDDYLWCLFDALHSDDDPEVKQIWRIEALEDFYQRQRHYHLSVL